MNGTDFKDLLRIAGPVIGTMASGDGQSQSAFMNAFSRGRALAQRERDQRQFDDARKQQGAAKFLMDIGTHAQGFDDPVALDEFLRTAGDAYEMSGFGAKGDVVGRFTVPESKQTAKRVKEIKGALDALKDYDLDQLEQSNAHVQLPDGSVMPISSARQLTQARPVDLSGKAIPKPKKAPTAASSDYSRFLDRYAKDKGKTVDLLTSADELDAKKQYGQADDKPADPTLAAIHELNRQLLANKVANAGKDDGPSPDKAFSMEQRLATSWTNATKATREMQRQFSLMKTGLDRFRKGDKNGGSQAVLVTFQKILDPTSVVRESEYARTAVGQSVLNRIEGYMDKLAHGGAGMTDGELSQMVETAREMLNDMGQFTQAHKRRIDASIKKYKLDPATVFDDALLGAPDVAPSAAPPSDARASAAAKLGKRK